MASGESNSWNKCFSFGWTGWPESCNKAANGIGVLYFQNVIGYVQPCLRRFSQNSHKLTIIMSSFLMQNFIQIASNGGQNGIEIDLYPLVKHSLHCAHTKRNYQTIFCGHPQNFTDTGRRKSGLSFTFLRKQGFWQQTLIRNSQSLSGFKIPSTPVLKLWDEKSNLIIIIIIIAFTPLSNVHPFLCQFSRNSQMIDDTWRSSIPNFIRNGKKKTENKVKIQICKQV